MLHGDGGPGEAVTTDREEGSWLRVFHVHPLYVHHGRGGELQGGGRGVQGLCHGYSRDMVEIIEIDVRGYSKMTSCTEGGRGGRPKSDFDDNKSEYDILF